jgi:hypothetical protein
MTAFYAWSVEIIYISSSSTGIAMIHTSLGTSPLRSGSFDGYVRLSFDELLKVDFNQKSYWEDRSLIDDLAEEHLRASNAGYCEWAGRHSGQNISIGWAWFETEKAQICLAPGGLSSNLMLMSSKYYDVGMQTTSTLLLSWLDGIDWKRCLARPPNCAPHKFGTNPN